MVEQVAAMNVSKFSNLQLCEFHQEKVMLLLLFCSGTSLHCVVTMYGHLATYDSGCYLFDVSEFFST